MNIARIAAMLSVNFRLCLLEIASSAGRTFITTFGLFLGVASLLANLAFVRGMDDDLRLRMEEIGGLSIVTLRNVEPKTPKERIAFQRSAGLSFSAVEQAVAGVPYVRSVLRSRELNWQPFSRGGVQAWGFLIAADTAFFPVYNYHVTAGRMLDDEDIRRARDVCIVGARLAKRLRCGDDPLGKTITVRNIPLTIVGVIGEGGVRSRRDVECLIPFSVYSTRFENAGRNLDEVSVVLASSDSTGRARIDLRRRYAAVNRGVNNFDVETSADKIKEMRTTSAALKMILWFIAAITLLVGGISIMNIMFATIGNRIREIGIRKALGAGGRDLFTQFLLEAVLVCFFGGLPGMFVGMAILLAPPGMFPYEPRLTAMDFSIAIGFTFLTGILSGLFPALRAANMQPVEALRY